MNPFPDPSARLTALCSEIGRGHPSYLDSTLSAVSRLAPGPAVPVSCARDLGSAVSRAAWGLAEAAYRAGGSGGVLTWLYNLVRSSTARPSGPALSILGSGLRRRFHDYQGICLVDHPLLAHVLAGTCRVAYVHGEIAAPALSAIPEAWRTFVPLESTASRLEAYGVKREALAVTGLLVEPELVDRAEEAYHQRLARLESRAPLTVGFFPSGAHPRPHVERIMAAAVSVARTGGRAVLFWRPGLPRATRVESTLQQYGFPPDAIRVIWSTGRQDETARTAELLPQLDVMVAATHERTNWAAGLGLPMLALMPAIGPFAQENFDFALRQSVCLALETVGDAHSAGSTLAELRRAGRLAQMCRNGWGRLPVTGAATAARELVSAARAA